MNNDKILDNNFLILKEHNLVYSPVGVLNFFRYKSKEEIKLHLHKNEENIQCIVSSNAREYGKNNFCFGESQFPTLNDYADGVDTIKFLLSL